jgi:hypothetical protein
MFLIFRSLGQRRQLSQAEYLLNALSMSEEAAVNDLTAVERKQILTYLENSDPDNDLVRALTAVMKKAKTVNTDDRNWLQKWIDTIVRQYEKAIQLPYALKVVNGIFIVKAFLFPVSTVLGPVHVLKNGFGSEAAWVVIMQFVSSAIAGLFVLAGILKMRKDRLRAYDLFPKSLLVDILITQLFSFYLSQFRDLYILFINLALYVALRFFIQQESRIAG